MIRNLKIYSTTPESQPQAMFFKKEIDGIDYYKKVVNTALWSEVHGFDGTLIYSNNSLVDGWSVAQIILDHTNSLTPLIAVNPVYIFPYALAKRIASLSFMYGRRIDINWIAGGFQNDLKSLGDETPHDKRYERLIDYALVVKGLLKNKGLFSHVGDFYKIDKIRMMPSISEELIPLELISGTSEAGINAADKLGATKVKYAKPLEDYKGIEPSKKYDLGVRFGIIARETAKEAWEVANTRFPDDLTGHRAHIMATKASDSNWHQQLTEIDEDLKNEVYWIKPFKTYKTFCPYLVGSHSMVAEQLAGYVRLGHTSIILDIMPEEEDFLHCKQVFETVELLTRDIF